MNIDLTDKQTKLLLETLAIAHQVEFLKGKNNDELADLILIIGSALKNEGKINIFNSVLMELKQ